MSDENFDSNNMDWQQVEKETVEAMKASLADAYEQIRDLAAMMQKQEAFIQDLKQRLQDKGYPVLEKSVWEMTRAEIIARNKQIPAIRFNQVKTKDKIPMPLPGDEFKLHEQRADEMAQEAMDKILGYVVEGVDLQKHGIDPVTLNFKEGFGPTATPPKVEYLDPPKRKHWWQFWK